ncbi:MAG: SRPBCC family protein, partial [Acidobacteriota bacterium]
RVAGATAAVAAVTALDVYCGQQLTSNVSPDGRVHAKKTIIIDRSPEEVYSFWQNFENFPRFMDHLESIRTLDDKRSHWKAKAVAGKSVEWDSEITDDRPNTLIAWRSVKDSDFQNAGVVRFDRATGGRGTLVTVELEYEPPGGSLGATIARILGSEPGQRIEDGLRLAKQILETGDIVRSDASIFPRMHAAQPAADTRQAKLSVIRGRDEDKKVPTAVGA